MTEKTLSLPFGVKDLLFFVFLGDKTSKHLCLNLYFFLDPLGCDSPPPLADGDIKGSFRFQYSHGERVEYICQNLYEMLGGPFQTCENGKWLGTMRCLSKLQTYLHVSWSLPVTAWFILKGFSD